MGDDPELLRRNPLAQRCTDRKCQDFLPPGATHLSRFRPGVAQTCAKQPKAQTAPAVTSRLLAGLSSRASRFCLKPERGEVASQPEPSHPFVLVLCAANSCREPGLPTRRAFYTHLSTHFRVLLCWLSLGSLASHPHPPFLLASNVAGFQRSPGMGGTGKKQHSGCGGEGGVRSGCKNPLDSSLVYFTFFSLSFLPMRVCIKLQDMGSEMSGFIAVSLEHEFFEHCHLGF